MNALTSAEAGPPIFNMRGRFTRARFARACAVLALAAVLVAPSPATAADYPVMSHTWMLQKTAWGGGSCSGKSTWIPVWTVGECNVAQSLGYKGTCDPTSDTSADHYVSLSPFAGMTKIYRLVSVQLGCKDSFVLTASESRKSTLVSQGWKVEKEVWAWAPTSQKSFYDWGLVPIWHGYSSSQADNFYTEHTYKMAPKYSAGYTTGFPEEPIITDPHQSGWPAMSVAYVAANGYLDLHVDCVVPGGGSCSWTLTGPGGWTKSGSGSWNAPKAPSHRYLLTCNTISGLKNVDPSQTHYLGFFKSHYLKCLYECDHTCDYAGQTQCSGSGVQTCQTNSYGCREWSGTTYCSDGNSCTTGDTCVNGSCQPGTPMDCSYLNGQCQTGACQSGACVQLSKSGPCTDSNSCTEYDSCQNGSCVGSPIDCSYLSDSCNTGVCSSGTCVKQPKSGSCNADSDACTVNDQCVGGKCVAGAAMSCSHLDKACQKGVCSFGSCTTQPLSGTCDDNDPCTIGDTCTGGQCMSGSPKDCSSLSNACQTGKCQGGTCVGVAKPESGCDDGVACTTDSCDPVNGCTHTAQHGVCSDGKACTTDVCSLTQGCMNEATTGPCSDGDACTLGDACAGGVCVPGAAKVCDDGNPCTDDACNASGACAYVANTAPCNDDNACTTGDSCSATVCKGSPVTCNDGIACTLDSCDPKTGCTYSAEGGPCGDNNPCTDDLCDALEGCTNVPNQAACTDGDTCTVDDTCAEGTCVSGPQKVCADDVACTTDTCDKSKGCVFTADSTKCDDGLACTADSCDAGSGCAHLAQAGACDDGNPCTSDACDTTLGCVSVNEAATLCDDGDPCTIDTCTKTAGCEHAAATGIPCNDGSACTVGDVCQSGVCVQGGSKCNDGNPCTADICDESAACSNPPLDGGCDNGDPCSLGDECVKGECVGTSTLKCNDSNPCTVDSCKTGEGCVFEPSGASCSDGNPCTEEDACKEGVCSPGSLADCDDGNPCTVDSCDPADGGCDHEPAAGPCDDGDTCTSGDTCGGGACTGTPTPDCCAADSDCANPNPTCLSVTCVGGKCQAAAFCAEGACGPNPCDESISCGTCFGFEACISGTCHARCSVNEKPGTRCVDDGKVLEKCQKDQETGDWYWKPADCIAAGEAGCAYSRDKGLSVCCTPDCSDKECGNPSACGVSCGLCEDGAACCEPGQDCAKADPATSFQCVDCCAGVECGKSPQPGCNEICGECSEGRACKSGMCISQCEDSDIDYAGTCAANVAWWCDAAPSGDLKRSVDCAANGLVCCFDEALGHVGCCNCAGECEEKGWECGTDSCGQPCGEDDGECGLGYDCVDETQQCVCVTPELCCQGECDANGWLCGTDSCGQPCGALEGGCEAGHECAPDSKQCVCATPDCGAASGSDAGADDAAADAVLDAGASEGGIGEQGCQCRTSGDAPLMGAAWMLAGALALLMLRGGLRRRRGAADANRL